VEETCFESKERRVRQGIYRDLRRVLCTAHLWWCLILCKHNSRTEERERRNAGAHMARFYALPARIFNEIFGGGLFTICDLVA